MNGLFGSFYRMINGLPPKAVMKAAELQSQMLEKDLLQHRIELDDQACSIITFCRFLKNFHSGSIVEINLAPHYILQCRQIIEKLVNTQILPYKALEHFDEVFSLQLVGTLQTY